MCHATTVGVWLPMKLLIAIPALNEEASIQQIIERCLQARQDIVDTSLVTQVEITVVSDGSTDRTVELAARFGDRIKLIVFAKNRGYGAAIKEAWAHSNADLLGFLDADGTCEPKFFAQLVNALEEHKADVVLGCRLNENSKMPWVRRVGNIIFASMLALLSSSKVRDTASGMRVVRRACLPELLPLPDGLHFTPAMSARAMFSDTLRIVEIDMTYHEREGESKLRPGKDGLRFVKAILDAALLYRPARPLAILGLIWLAVAVVLMLTPTAHYVKYRTVEEWMIYRFVVSHLAGTLAALLLCASYLTGRMVAIALTRGRRNLLDWFFASWMVWAVPPILLIVGGVLVLPSFLELVRTGATYEHWSRFIAMSFCWVVASIVAVTGVIDYVLGLLGTQLAYNTRAAE
jgi:glycosyltransferase involved in cell wall biosynthesis